MPFGPYRDFDDCVRKNQDKSNPQAYCAALERRIKENEQISRSSRFSGKNN